MVMLRAFRPLRYNPEVIRDLSTVVAPPYDVISKEHRDALHERSPHNIVHLILNRAADPYSAVAALYKTWRDERVLVREQRPALCFYVEEFALPDGSRRRREGLIGVVRIEPFESGQIRPHERTFARAKEDRMRVMRSCNANLSPIFAMFADRTEVLDRARQASAACPPDCDVQDDSGVHHRLWLLTDPSLIATLSGMLADEPAFIADGHHRYETAMTYRNARHAEGANDPEAPHNFVLMYLTSMNHPGLVVLPTHRVLSGIQGFNGSELLAHLRQHFQLRSFPRTAKNEFVACLREAPQREKLGIILAESDQLFVATLADRAVLDTYAPGVAPVVQQLDVTLLDSVVLRGLLGIDCTARAQEGQLTYTHDERAALAAVDRGAQAAFLMNPPRLDDVQAVCLAGKTMPEKSTYFFPKLLTGLVFHALEETDGAVAS